MKDNSKIVAIVLVILAAIVLIVNFIINKFQESDEESNVSIVTNYSNFYTVNSCLYRTITYISSKDTESLLLLLPEQYKNEHKVNNSNVLDLFPEVTENSTFISEKMYYENLSNNIVKYYVKGYIEENRIFDDENLEKLEIESIYFIVYLDSSDNIFSIEPYDGNIFKVGDIIEE